MRLISRPLPGMLVLQTEPRTDERGFFRAAFVGMNSGGSASPPASSKEPVYSEGRARGLHYQMAPSAETKVLTCLQGAVHDVSPGRQAELSDLWAPRRGRAYGRQSAHGRGAGGLRTRLPTLRDDTLLLYLAPTTRCASAPCAGTIRHSTSAGRQSRPICRRVTLPCPTTTPVITWQHDVHRPAGMSRGLQST